MTFIKALEKILNPFPRKHRFVSRLRAQPQERKTLLDILIGTKKDISQTWKK